MELDFLVFISCGGTDFYSSTAEQGYSRNYDYCWLLFASTSASFIARTFRDRPNRLMKPSAS